MDEHNSWMHIVDRYLNAIYNDQIDSLKRKLTNHRSTVLRECGTELISQRFQNEKNQRIKNAISPVAREHWRVTEHSDTQILVTIPVDGKLNTNTDQPPFISTRISLDKIQGEWKISEIYRPCITCNSTRQSSTSAGACRLCRGTGALVDRECKFCSGSGKCKCSDTETPGWKRLTF